jgi:hypothetical protein
MSDWNERAVKRRDARHTKGPDDKIKPTPAKKNTKKWCRGKVGIEHKPVCRDYSEVKRTGLEMFGRKVNLYKGWKLLVCAACGKELATYYPFGSDKRNPPEWAQPK